MAPFSDAGSRRDGLYAEAAATYGAALERLAHAYEPDADRRLDLLQEVHVALWRSFASFDGRCSLRTWVYRVAHNVATSQVIRRRRRAPALVGLDELESMSDAIDHEQVLDDRRALDRMMVLIHPRKCTASRRYWRGVFTKAHHDRPISRARPAGAVAVAVARRDHDVA